MISKENLAKDIVNFKDLLISISHKIHQHPELAFEEKKAASLLTQILRKEKFEIKNWGNDLPTAFAAKIGMGSLHIAICAEYDALPHVGHACGHNIIAASAIGAALLLKKIIKEIDITLHVIGTPAEERGGGKVILLEKGAFSGIHAAMMIHPAPKDELYPTILAARQLKITYIGKEAHASAYPDQGINAADAMTIAQTAIGLLRQQLKPIDKVHGIITKGGDAANIIPNLTQATYLIRSSDLRNLKLLHKKVKRCFEAGALASGATLKIEESEKPYANMIHDQEIGQLYYQNAVKLGRKFEEYKKDFAGSTDMGNVSQIIPAIHPMIGINSKIASNHQAAFSNCCISKDADQAILDGSVAMAWTIMDIVQNTKLKNKLLKRSSAKK